MKLLLVTPYFPPQPAIASRRVHAYAAAWLKAGHEVTVLTTQKRADQRGLDLPCDGIEVVEIPFTVPRVLERFRNAHKSRQFSSTDNGVEAAETHGRVTKSLLRLRDELGVFSSIRMPDLTDYWVKPAALWCIAQRNRRWDAMLSSCGPYTAHLAARIVKRRDLARVWAAEFRDLWTENHIQRGLFPFTIRERILEKKCLREADLLVTVSEALASKLRRRSGKNVEIIYNGFDADAFATLSSERIFAQDNTFRIVFTGTLYTLQQGLDPRPLLRAMASLRETHPHVASRLRLVVAGQGGELWAELAAQFNLEDMIEIRGLINGADALRLQRDADALLLLDNVNPVHGVLSGKAFEYLAVAAPILVVGGGVQSPMGLLVEKARRGWNVSCDVQRIKATLIELMDHSSTQSSTLPASSAPWSGDRAFISQFSRERQSMLLLEFMRAKCEQPS